METKFTKGQWIVYDKNDGWDRMGSDELIIGMSSYNKDYSQHYCCHKILIDSSEEEARANANLIACAPEMYDALKKIKSWAEEHDEWWVINQINDFNIDELLPKARGEL